MTSGKHSDSVFDKCSKTQKSEENLINIRFCIVAGNLHFQEIFVNVHQTMKTEEKGNSPKVRIAVLGNMNVGKSGKCIFLVI